MTASGAPIDDAAQRLRTARAALSELFLDQELDEGDRDRLCEVLAATGLDLATLDRVYAEELEPLLAGNLQSPAGEWAGFDIDELEARIRERQGQGHGWRRLIEQSRKIIGGVSPARDEWVKLREMLSARRPTTD